MKRSPEKTELGTKNLTEFGNKNTMDFIGPYVSHHLTLWKDPYITAHGSRRSLTDAQSGSGHKLSVRVVSNLGPPLLSITDTICSYCNQPSGPPPCRSILCQLRNRSCEVCLWKRRDSLCRKRNLEQVWLSRKRKNRACLCTSEPSRGGSVNPFILGQFGHVTRQHQFISTIPHRLAQNNPPPPLSSTNHDPQFTGTSSLRSVRLSDVVNISAAVSLSNIGLLPASLWIRSMNFSLFRQSERPGFQSPSEVGWR